jgi:hypothetical protein
MGDFGAVYVGVRPGMGTDVSFVELKVTTKLIKYNQ